MAKPRVFVSSTYYDLKHIRSSLDVFISSLGYEAILSEKGDIAYAPDQPLDESCYREAQTCDIFVLLLGGRYGSAASSDERSGAEKDFFHRYESITKQEYKAALQEDIPIYILVEAGVYGEYQTFRKNRDNTSIEYAHVDSINIFTLLDDILVQKRNNPVHGFEKYSDIENWLRDQWAGLFRDLLNRRSGQAQLTSLATQVSEMSEVNRTLRRYIEMIVSQLAPEKSEEIIESENERLRAAKEEEVLKSVHLFEWLEHRISIPRADAIAAVRKARSMEGLRKSLAQKAPGDISRAVRMFTDSDFGAFIELNKVREAMGLCRLEPMGGG